MEEYSGRSMKSSVTSQLASSAVATKLVWRVRKLMLELGAVLILLLVVAGGSLVARQYLPAYAVDLTVKWPRNRMHLVNFHGLEENREFEYRWSSAYSFIQLPFGYHAAPAYLADVRVRTAHPQWMHPLTFLANEHAFLTVTPDTTFRVYRFIMPPGGNTDGTLRLALQTVPFSPPGDQRELGVVLTDITLQPLPYRDWSVAMVLSLALLGLWVWLRWIGTSLGATLLICSGLMLVLLGCYALYQPAPLRYEWLVLLVVPASAVAAMMAHEMVVRLSLSLIAALVSFSGVLWPSWLSDDAFISFRYAQNLVAGHGLVYNVGERVEGYTNFLWTMLAALVIVLDGDPVFWAYVAGVILALGILLLTYRIARQLLGSAWALVAALIVATSQNLLIHTARGAGLETGLFTLLALGSSIMYVCWWSEQRSITAILCGSSFALASLTRPEGVLLTGLTILHMLLIMPHGLPGFNRAESAITDARPRKQHTLWLLIKQKWSVVCGPITYLLGVYLVIMVPYFLWRMSYYGDWLPNTFYAKTGGGLQQAWRGLEYTWRFIVSMGGPFILIIFVPVVINRWTTVKSWRGYFLLLVSAYSIYIIAVGGDHFYGVRFFVPLIPWFAMLIADGLAWIYRWCIQRTTVRLLAPAVLAIGLLVFSGYALTRSMHFDYILRGQDESVWMWRELGWWMHDHANPDESIAVTGAGAIAYYSEHTTIDLLGLTEKYIARVEVENMGSGAAGHEKHAPDYVLQVRRPTYIPRMWDSYFGGEDVLRDHYQLIHIQTRYGREMELWKRLH